MNVRVGLAADLAAVMPMLRKHRAAHQALDESFYALRPDAEARFQRWLGPVTQDPRALLMVAEEAGQVVGFVTALVEKDVPIYACDEYAIIRDLWVEEPFRGRGIGKALVRAASEEFAAMGIGQVRIRTAAGNEPGRKLLGACGFRVCTVDLVRELKPPRRRASKRGEKKVSANATPATDVTASKSQGTPT